MARAVPPLPTLLLLNPARTLDLGEPAAVVGGGWQEAVGRLSTTAAAAEQASTTEVAAGPGLLRLKQSWHNQRKMPSHLKQYPS